MAERITLGRLYLDRHPGLSAKSGPCKARPIKTQVDVAALLDDAAYQTLVEHGAASAHAEIGYGQPDDEDYEPVESMGHPDVVALPLGTPAEARRAIRKRRGDSAWDGHNHVPRPVFELTELLARMRQQQ